MLVFVHHRRSPPGPRSAPPQLFLRDPFPYMRALAERYGDPARVPLLGAPPITLTWSPEGIRTIFTADPMGFGSATSEALSVILGRGSIFLLSGAAHRRTRTLLAPPFHGERTRAYAEATQRAARRWSATLERDRVVPILSVTQKITLDVIIEAIFGEQDPSRVKTLHTKILAVVEAFNPMIASFKLLQREFGGLGPWARFQARARALHADLSALIEGKRDRPDDDVLSLLLSASDERGDPLAEDEIIDQLITFVIAGHETTATSLAWSVYELHRAPETRAKLRAEIEGAGGSDASAEALAKLPHLGAVADETLRLHPPVPIVTRKSEVPLELERLYDPRRRIRRRGRVQRPLPSRDLRRAHAPSTRALRAQELFALRVLAVRRRSPSLPRRGLRESRAPRGARHVAQRATLLARRALARSTHLSHRNLRPRDRRPRWRALLKTKPRAIVDQPLSHAHRAHENNGRRRLEGSGGGASRVSRTTVVTRGAETSRGAHCTRRNNVGS